MYKIRLKEVPKMNEKNNIDINKKKEILIGSLLLMPIYIVPLIFLILSKTPSQYKFAILPILICTPIIIGIILLYKTYKEKISKPFIIILTIWGVAAIRYFYLTYFGDYEGWDGLNYFFLLMVDGLILKFLLFVFWGTLVGKKKAFLYFLTYLAVVVSLIGIAIICVQILQRPELIRIF